MKIIKNALKMRNNETNEFEPINGFIGETGVHVGSNEPLGTGVDVWIDTVEDGSYDIYERNDIIDLIYPIGSIYMSVNDVSPAVLFGGNWEQLEDRFLLGAGSTYTNGATGGSATHKLTVNEMPAHTHSVLRKIGTAADGNDRATLNGEGTTLSGVINSTGGSQAHNNMPPYLVVYMWKRIP